MCLALNQCMVFYAREHSDVDKRPALIINGGGQKIITTAPTENLVKNGSFEQPVVGSYKSYYPGQDIEGWQVIKAAVDITGTYFKSSEGKQSIDLHGTGGFGGIQQTIATKPNTKYTLTFDFAGNAVGGPTVKEMKVSAAGQSQVFKFDCTGKNTQNMGWVGQTWQFVANSTNTILIFETLTTSGVDRYGPAIDNVKVMEGSGLGQIVSNDLKNPTTIPASVGGEWKVNQSTGHYGTLRFEVNSNGQITGSASWNGNLFGTIKGSVSGKAIVFTISYPGNVTGLYKGTLSNDGTKIRNGTTEGSNGVRATWEASR